MIRNIIMLVIVVMFSIVSCQNKQKLLVDDGVYVIPVPAEITIKDKYFKLNKNTKILFQGDSEEEKWLVNYLSADIFKKTGFELDTENSDTREEINNTIVLKKSTEITKDEGYRLSVNEKQILISAQNTNGLFYGIQSLYQMIPITSVNKDKNIKKLLNIRAVEITYYPRFGWRGMHLDVSRHFFPKSYIKKYLDHLARYKFNKFHWHLTDGPGWRIEIERYPRLNSIASWRIDKRNKSWDWTNTEIGKPNDGRPVYGGYYSKADIKEIVDYAAKRYIEVIPEIEMPGHSYAPLVAYPELACVNNNIVRDGLYGKDVFCVANPKTYEFLEGVIDEVVELFPSKFFHLGGDEVGKQAWKDCSRCQQLLKNEKLKNEEELQSYFIKKMASYIEKKGKEVVGWDEIMEGEVAKNAKVMSWRGMDGGIKAANLGHDVIMAPNSFTYFDLYQGDPELEPDAYSSLYLSKVYQFDPVPQDINNDKKHHILGGHGCLWTETVQTFGHVEYMIFPRMLALSETIWSPKVNLDWNSFINRMEHHQLDLENQGINFSKSAYQANIHVAMDSSKNQLLVQINNELNKHTIRYSTDGTDPESSSKLYDGPFLLKEKAQIKAATFRNGRRYSQISLKSFNKNKATGKKIIYTHKYNPSYTAGGNAGLVNGLSGSKDFHDGFWQGFQKHDLNVTIDLGLSETIRSISTNFYHNPGSWIYLPYQVSFLISEDGETFSEIKNFENITLDTNGIQSYSNKFKPQNARYIKIIGKNIGTRPGRPNEEAWIFIDEITVN